MGNGRAVAGICIGGIGTHKHPHHIRGAQPRCLSPHLQPELQHIVNGQAGRGEAGCLRIGIGQRNRHHKIHLTPRSRRRRQLLPGVKQVFPAVVFHAPAKVGKRLRRARKHDRGVGVHRHIVTGFGQGRVGGGGNHIYRIRRAGQIHIVDNAHRRNAEGERLRRLQRRGNICFGDKAARRARHRIHTARPHRHRRPFSLSPEELHGRPGRHPAGRSPQPHQPARRHGYIVPRRNRGPRAGGIAGNGHR